MNLQMLADRYFKMTKTYGLFVGTWPYQSQYRKWIHRALFFVIAISSVTTMVSNIVVFFSVESITDQTPTLMIPTGMMVKCFMIMLYDSKFKDLFNSILKDWQDKKTREEEIIMETYAEKGAFFALIYTLNATACSTIFLCLPLMPHLMDFLVPLNESRPRIQMYSAYYFTENEDDYYYIIILYTGVASIIALCAYIASDTTLICLIQHACGLFALSGHRLKNSVDQTLKMDSSMDQKAYKTVCYAIDTHKRALEYLNDIGKLYALNLFVQVGLVVLSLTMTLLKVTTVTLSMETYPHYGYVIAQLVHIFFLTIQGQFVIDSHEDVYSSGYEAYWYNGDCKTQALFILILRKNLTPPLLTAGGLIQLNLDTFAMIVKTCVSYFTVLKSV